MRTNNFARHGDLSFRKISALPKQVIKSDDKVPNGFVLARGEHTGHKHVITVERGDSQVEFLTGEDGRTYLQVNGVATLTHEEHNPITFESGIYEMKIEREYDYFLEEVKQVLD